MAAVAREAHCLLPQPLSHASAQKTPSLSSCYAISREGLRRKSGVPDGSQCRVSLKAVRSGVRCEAQAIEREIVKGDKKEKKEDAFSGLSQVCAVLGTQWGDEGKGKLVDILAQRYDIVARSQVHSPSVSLTVRG